MLSHLAQCEKQLWPFLFLSLHIYLIKLYKVLECEISDWLKSYIFSFLNLLSKNWLLFSSGSSLLTESVDCILYSVCIEDDCKNATIKTSNKMNVMKNRTQT